MLMVIEKRQYIHCTNQQVQQLCQGMVTNKCAADVAEDGCS